MNNSIMYQEIHMIRDSLKLTYDANKDKIKDFVKTFKEKEIRNVVIAASSVITKYNSYLNFKNTLVIGISQSGSGKDIFEFVDKAKNNGALTLAITNDSSSIVAKVCDYHFCLNLKFHQLVHYCLYFLLNFQILNLN